MSKEDRFPADFLWGVATSSHQTEGNNRNNNWWEWEQKGKTKNKSGWACDSWNRYPIDHQLAQELGCNAFRLSFEWSRIEPVEGHFDQEAVEHYRKVLIDLKNRGMKRIVTLWHWTLPLWFSKKYGWHKKEAVEIFSRYCETVVRELGGEIDLIITLNEPRLPLNRGYLLAEHPPGRRNPFLFFAARNNMIKAHGSAYDVCKKIRPEIPVGITQFTNDFDFLGKIKALKFLTEKIEDFYNWHFFERIGEKQDFIGVNYYYGFDTEVRLGIPPYRIKHDSERRNDLNWGIDPEGIHEVVMDGWKRYHKPIYIFENGAADANDQIRAEYIKAHLKWLGRSIEKGADVRGYFYWSLIDNFEWSEGFGPKFGLCEVDFKTMERKPRGSFYEYQKIIKNHQENSKVKSQNSKVQLKN